MKRLHTIWIASLILGGPTLVAGDVPKTLPAEFYKSSGHRQGKKAMCWVWTAQGYDKSKGFSWDGKLVWAAVDRCIPFRDRLKAGLEDLAKPESPYKLTATVVLSTSSSRLRGWRS